MPTQSVRRGSIIAFVALMASIVAVFGANGQSRIDQFNGVYDYRGENSCTLKDGSFEKKYSLDESALSDRYFYFQGSSGDIYLLFSPQLLDAKTVRLTSGTTKLTLDSWCTPNIKGCITAEYTDISISATQLMSPPDAFGRKEEKVWLLQKAVGASSQDENRFYFSSSVFSRYGTEITRESTCLFVVYRH